MLITLSIIFIYIEGKSRHSEHAVKKGHNMKAVEETMSVIHLKNDHSKIDILEQIEILTAPRS